MHCDMLAKPIGVLKVFLVILGLIGLVSIFDYRGSFVLMQSCPQDPHQKHTSTLKWEYPFVLTKIMLPLVVCNSTPPEQKDGHDHPMFFINFNRQAQFFGFMAGVSALAAAVWLFIYVSAWFHYSFDQSLTSFDTLLSMSISLLWLCASCSWASGFMTLKQATGLDQLWQTVQGYSDCRNGADCTIAEKKQESVRGGFSVVVGFCCCVLWFLGAILAYRQHRTVIIERRGLMGETRSTAQTRSAASAIAEAAATASRNQPTAPAPSYQDRHNAGDAIF